MNIIAYLKERYSNQQYRKESKAFTAGYHYASGLLLRCVVNAKKPRHIKGDVNLDAFDRGIVAALEDHERANKPISTLDTLGLASTGISIDTNKA